MYASSMNIHNPLHISSEYFTPIALVITPPRSPAITLGTLDPTAYIIVWLEATISSFIFFKIYIDPQYVNTVTLTPVIIPANNNIAAFAINANAI